MTTGMLSTRVVSAALLLWMLLSSRPLSADPAPGGAPPQPPGTGKRTNVLYFTHWSKSLPTATGADKKNWKLTIDISPKSTEYYWAEEAFFVPGQVMYMGFQNRTHPAVIFSVFGPGTAAVTPSCSPGADQKPGTHCRIPYPWHIGTTYVLQMERVSTDAVAGTQIWRGTVRPDGDASEGTVIGEVSVPLAWQGLRFETDSFVEYYEWNAGKYVRNPAIRPPRPLVQTTFGEGISWANGVAYPGFIRSYPEGVNFVLTKDGYQRDETRYLSATEAIARAGGPIVAPPPEP